MVIQTMIKIYEVDSRHSIYLPKDFVSDSAFPFKPKKKLIAKIENKRVIIERVPVASIGNNRDGVRRILSRCAF